ncbi:hypothetical protein RHK62_07625, partial [Thermosynechococcus sp. HY213]|uniref:hypothetical protein n=1 Tax=Thermosynechococcus sp. HY213 TaxID=3074104 RepID=UPI0028646FF5
IAKRIFIPLGWLSTQVEVVFSILEHGKIPENFSLERTILYKGDPMDDLDLSTLAEILHKFYTRTPRSLQDGIFSILTNPNLLVEFSDNWKGLFYLPLAFHGFDLAPASQPAPAPQVHYDRVKTASIQAATTSSGSRAVYHVDLEPLALCVFTQSKTAHSKVSKLRERLIAKRIFIPLGWLSTQVEVVFSILEHGKIPENFSLERTILYKGDPMDDSDLSALAEILHKFYTRTPRSLQDGIFSILTNPNLLVEFSDNWKGLFYLPLVFHGVDLAPAPQPAPAPQALGFFPSRINGNTSS